MHYSHMEDSSRTWVLESYLKDSELSPSLSNFKDLDSSLCPRTRIRVRVFVKKMSLTLWLKCGRFVPITFYEYIRCFTCAFTKRWWASLLNKFEKIIYYRILFTFIQNNQQVTELLEPFGKLTNTRNTTLVIWGPLRTKWLHGEIYTYQDCKLLYFNKIRFALQATNERSFLF